MFPEILTPELSKKLKSRTITTNAIGIGSMVLMLVSLFVPGSLGVVVLILGTLGLLTSLVLLSLLQKFEQKILLEYFHSELTKGTPNGESKTQGSDT